MQNHVSVVRNAALNDHQECKADCREHWYITTPEFHINLTQQIVKMYPARVCRLFMWTVTLVSVVITSCHSAKSDDDDLIDENRQDYYDENLPPGNFTQRRHAKTQYVFANW